MATGKLQQELKKRQPFDSLPQEAMLNVLRSCDQFQNRFGRLFREYGLTCSQYNILRILRGEGKPLPCLEIASRMIQVVPAITGLLDRLGRAELIVRRRSSSDRRVVLVEITQEALDLLARIDRPLLDLHEQLIGHLSEAEMHDLIRLLEKARAPLDGQIAVPCE